MKELVAAATIVAVFALSAAGEEAQEVTVTSTPPGAMVFVNNAYQGTTPMAKELAHGTYRIRLKRKGYRDWTRDITVPLENPRIEAPLKAIKKGTITITSKPRECTVYLNGQKKGITPLLLKDLPNDVYEVRVQKPNYTPHKQTVEITDGKGVELSIELQSRVIAYLVKQIEKSPGDLSKYTELGHQYLLEGKWDEAGEIFKKGAPISTMRKAREHARYFYQELCKAYSGQFKFADRSDLQQFRDSFRDVIESVIEHGAKANVYYQQLMSLYAARNPHAIMALAERTHASDPTRRVHREFGSIYLERGMSSQAIKMFTRALEIEDVFESRFNLASAYHRRGNFNKALTEYRLCEKMRASSQESGKLTFEMARLFDQMGESKKALTYINKALEHPQEATWKLLKVRILINSGNLEAAKSLAENLIESPGRPRIKKDAEFMLKRINKLLKKSKTQER